MVLLNFLESGISLLSVLKNVSNLPINMTLEEEEPLMLDAQLDAALSNLLVDSKKPLDWIIPMDSSRQLMIT